MKTRYWIILFAAILAICTTASIFLMQENGSRTATISQNGTIIQTVNLTKNQTFEITNGKQSNIICVENGKISVIKATCPDQYCVKQGAHNGGTPIVCLPNRLVISFSDGQFDAIG